MDTGEHIIQLKAKTKTELQLWRAGFETSNLLCVTKGSVLSPVQMRQSAGFGRSDYPLDAAEGLSRARKSLEETRYGLHVLRQFFMQVLADTKAKPEVAEKAVTHFNCVTDPLAALEKGLAKTEKAFTGLEGQAEDIAARLETEVQRNADKTSELSMLRTEITTLRAKLFFAENPQERSATALASAALTRGGPATQTSEEDTVTTETDTHFSDDNDSSDEENAFFDAELDQADIDSRLDRDLKDAETFHTPTRDKSNWLRRLSRVNSFAEDPALRAFRSSSLQPGEGSLPSPSFTSLDSPNLQAARGGPTVAVVQREPGLGGRERSSLGPSREVYVPRDRLPHDRSKEKVSLWKLLKSMVGKDLTSLTLPA